MPCWYYDKNYLKNTPSFKSGVSPEVEAKYRLEGARFIQDAGIRMGLGYNTCATAAVFFHRFYLFHSFAEFSHFVTAVACLYCAGKVEETPKQCKDLIDMAQRILTQEQFDAFKHNRENQIATLERILLQTIKFDFIVKHPYAYLLRYAKLVKGEKAKVEKLVQMSWTFINESLCTTLPLQWEPDIIAVAVMYLASRLSEFEITDWEGKSVGCEKKWFECFVEDATIDLLEDVCHQVLDLYSKPKKSEATSPGSLTTKASHESFQNSPKSGAPTSPKPQIHNEECVAKSNLQTIVQNKPVDHVASASFQQPTSISQSFSQAHAANGMYSSSSMNAPGTQSIQSVVAGQSTLSQYANLGYIAANGVHSSSSMNAAGTQSSQSVIGQFTSSHYANLGYFAANGVHSSSSSMNAPGTQSVAGQCTSSQYANLGYFAANGVHSSSSSMNAPGTQSVVAGQCISSQYAKHVEAPQNSSQVAGQSLHVPAIHTQQKPPATFSGRLTITKVPLTLPVTTNLQSSSQATGVVSSNSFQDHQRTLK